MAGLTTVSGLASGLDWRSMIDQIKAVEHKPIDLVVQQKTLFENKLKAWQELNTRLLALRSAAEKLRKPEGFDLYRADLRSSSATEPTAILSATVGATAETGTYNIEILQTAQAQKRASQSFSSSTVELGAGYAGTFQINGQTVTVAADDTLADVRTKINNLNVGEQATKVSASIVAYSPTDYRLILTSQQEGAAGFELLPEGSTGLVAAFGFSEIQAGRDAQLEVDGIALTRSSNTIADALTGVTLNLKKAEVGTTITLDVNQDVTGVSDLIKELVDQYNEVMDYIRTQSSYDSVTKKAGGVLFGDGTLRSVKSDLVESIITPISGVSTSFSILGQVGINLDNQGKLTVKEETLKGYLESNPEDVLRLFAATGTSDNSQLNYITHGRNTLPGIYLVNITQAPGIGIDVAGTINGETAIGSGEILTGAAGEAHIDGLVARYSGAETGPVGSVTFTAGVAETLYQSLYSITDTFNGYVSFKQTSLQESIKRFDTQTSEMEARLEKRMEVMTNRFVLMEKTLSQLQSMSNWLSSQINTLTSSS
jgi:flagellar hook-associated protein 2